MNKYLRPKVSINFVIAKFLHRKRRYLPLLLYTIGRVFRPNTHSNVTADHDHGRSEEQKDVRDLNEKEQFAVFNRKKFEKK